MIHGHFSTRLIIIVLFLMAFFFILYDATCSAEEAPLYLQKEVVRLKEQRTSLLQSEARVRESLDRARKAAELTGDHANPEDRQVVREAVATAEEAFALVQNLRTKIDLRLRALEQASRDRSSGKDFGLVAVQTGPAHKQSHAGSAALHYSSRVYEEDTLSTGKQGFLELFTPDAGYHMLAPSTTVRVAEFDRTTSLMTLDIERGRVHGEKLCGENDASCWATRYRTPNGIISFGSAELVYELKTDGTEVISVLDGAVVYREKQSRKATTVRLGEQLIRGPRGESVTLRKLPKEGIANWWDVDLQFEM